MGDWQPPDQGRGQASKAGTQGGAQQADKPHVRSELTSCLLVRYIYCLQRVMLVTRTRRQHMGRDSKAASLKTLPASHSPHVTSSGDSAVRLPLCSFPGPASSLPSYRDCLAKLGCIARLQLLTDASPIFFL